MKFNWLKNTGFLLLLLLIFGNCRQYSYKIAPHTPEQEGVITGKYIHTFSLPDSTGQIISVEHVMGKTSIIDFWASWCRPCRESANPHYKKLYQEFHWKGLQIIGVSSDRHRYFWIKAMREDSLPWVQLIDSTHRVLKQFRVKSIPTMLLIDRHGKVVGKNLWGDDLHHKIDSLLQDD